MLVRLSAVRHDQLRDLLVQSWRLISALWASIAIRKAKTSASVKFHDDLIKNGSLPLSIVEWILLDDRSSLDQALK